MKFIQDEDERYINSDLIYFLCISEDTFNDEPCFKILCFLKNETFDNPIVLYCSDSKEDCEDRLTNILNYLRCE